MIARARVLFALVLFCSGSLAARADWVGLDTDNLDAFDAYGTAKEMADSPTFAKKFLERVFCTVPDLRDSVVRRFNMAIMQETDAQKKVVLETGLAEVKKVPEHIFRYYQL